MSTSELLSVIEADGAAPGHDTGLSKKELVHLYRAMVLTRAFDTACMNLQRSGQIGFSIPNKGVEATSVGAASAFRKDDMFFPSYRDFGVPLYHDVEPVEMMHNMFGNGSDTSKGRQMPVHFSFDDPIRLVSISSPIGTQIIQAVGAAYAFQQRGEDKVCMASFGDGGTSSAGFHSALNFAGVWKAPVVFLCQNNGYAISCPSEGQTASESYAIKGIAYGVPGVKVDGNDVFAVRQATVEAVERARRGDGPTLIECVTFRMGGHSTADDPTKYVPADIMAAWAKRDPIDILERALLKMKVLTKKKFAEIKEEVAELTLAAGKTAASIAPPKLEEIFSDVYEEIPEHIRRQGAQAFDLAKRKGDANAGDGEFPL
ncbi:MAG: pyruvate dehydrogenase E1 component alpha subunit [Planctomycetota bacterium]|jgi:pyruvate dehydrogenase E1 component alpha subunit